MNNSFRSSNCENEAIRQNKSYSYTLNNQNQKCGYRNNFAFNQGYNQSQKEQMLNSLGWNQINSKSQHGKSKDNINTSWSKHNNSYENLSRRCQKQDSFQQSGQFKKNEKQSFVSDAKSKSGKSIKQHKISKAKVPTVKQESINEFYFPTIIETTDYAACPFNPQHIMQPDRLLTHISKCKLKSQNSHFYSQCPYEPCHYVYTSDLPAHKLSCNKRHLFVISDWDQVRDLPSQMVEIDANQNNPLNHSNYFDQTAAFTIRRAPSSVNEEKLKFEDLLIDP